MLRGAINISAVAKQDMIYDKLRAGATMANI
jgi:hypothetical protein